MHITMYIFCLKPSVCRSAFIVIGETNENHVLFKGNYGAVKWQNNKRVVLLCRKCRYESLSWDLVLQGMLVWETGATLTAAPGPPPTPGITPTPKGQGSVSKMFMLCSVILNSPRYFGRSPKFRNDFKCVFLLSQAQTLRDCWGVFMNTVSDGKDQRLLSAGYGYTVLTDITIMESIMETTFYFIKSTFIFFFSFHSIELVDLK